MEEEARSSGACGASASELGTRASGVDVVSVAAVPWRHSSGPRKDDRAREVRASSPPCLPRGPPQPQPRQGPTQARSGLARPLHQPGPWPKGELLQRPCSCWPNQFRPVDVFLLVYEFANYPEKTCFTDYTLMFMHLISHKLCIGLKWFKHVKCLEFCVD